MSVFPSFKCFTHLLTLLEPIHAMKSLVGDCRVSLFHKKLNDSTLTKRHAGDSHFLSMHDGNVRGAQALIVRSYFRGKVAVIVL